MENIRIKLYFALLNAEFYNVHFVSGEGKYDLLRKMAEGEIVTLNVLEKVYSLVNFKEFVVPEVQTVLVQSEEQVVVNGNIKLD